MLCALPNIPMGLSHSMQRHLDHVEAGYYRYRRVRAGPWVAAEIRIDDDMVVLCDDGQSASLGVKLTWLQRVIVESVMEGEAFRHPIIRILWFGEPIDASEYNRLLDRPACIDINRPIDINEVPIDLIV